jgi:hypothetical protein
MMKEKKTPIACLFVPYLKIHNCPYLSLADTNKIVLSSNVKTILNQQQKELKTRKVYEF